MQGRFVNDLDTREKRRRKIEEVESSNVLFEFLQPNQLQCVHRLLPV